MPVKKQLPEIKLTPLRGKLTEAEVRAAVKTVLADREEKAKKAAARSA
jgi:hypothetical protein